VAAEPNVYAGKETAVRRCENVFAVGDALGMCRFTTRLFNSPNLPGYEEFAPQIRNVTGIELSEADLDRCGQDIMGLERMLNARFGQGRADDTLPARWFDEPVTVGRFKGEKVDRAEFDALLSRFYAVSELDAEGHPNPAFRARLEGALAVG
jgi:aldehyde:ferredoxin oxidoreductase